jgi:hypothetical protein
MFCQTAPVHEAHFSPWAGGCIGRGIACISEGRAAGAKMQARLADVFAAFPRLKERVRQLAGTMSGGDQAMLSIGRGSASWEPRNT